MGIRDYVDVENPNSRVDVDLPLRIVDDLGNVHGVLEVDIEARAPCVNAKPQPIQAKFVSRNIRKSNFGSRADAKNRQFQKNSSSRSSSSSSDSQVPTKNTTI